MAPLVGVSSLCKVLASGVFKRTEAVWVTKRLGIAALPHQRAPLSCTARQLVASHPSLILRVLRSSSCWGMLNSTGRISTRGGWCWRSTSALHCRSASPRHPRPHIFLACALATRHLLLSPHLQECLASRYGRCPSFPGGVLPSRVYPARSHATHCLDALRPKPSLGGVQRHDAAGGPSKGILAADHTWCLG